MRILALETSGSGGSVAALLAGQPLAERELPAGTRSAQSLAPTIEAVLDEAGWRPADVELVAVTSGPGSFTSLRIGLATAKAFAYAVGAAILGVNTLEVIARQCSVADVGAGAGQGASSSERPAGENQVIRAVLDAQRQQLFAASFTRTADGGLEWLSPTEVVDRQAWLAALRPGDIVIGPELARLEDRLPPGTLVADPALWRPTAVVTGQLAWEHFSAGRRDDVFQLVPQYFRRTAAEEQWERKGGK